MAATNPTGIDKRAAPSPIQIHRPIDNDEQGEGPGGKHFVCPDPHCKKQFARKSNLTRHSRIHSKEKRFKCPSCDKTFTEKHHLTAHVRTHTGERPYTCLACSRQFTDRSNMLRHVRTHGDAAVQMHQLAEEGRIPSVDEKGLVPLVASMGRPTIATAVPSPNFSAVSNGVSLRPRNGGSPRFAQQQQQQGKQLPPVIATLLSRPQTREASRRVKVSRSRAEFNGGGAEDNDETDSEGDTPMSKSAAKRAKIKPLDTKTAEAADVLLNMNTPTQTSTRGFPVSPISNPDLGAPTERRKTLRSSRSNDIRRLNMDSMTPTAAAAMGLSPLASTLSPYMGSFGTPMSYSSNSPYLSSYVGSPQALQCIISIPTPVVANVVPQARLTPNMESVTQSPSRFPVPVKLPMSYSSAAMSNGTTDSTFSSQTSALRSVANATAATMMPSITPTAASSSSSGGFTIGGPAPEARESPSAAMLSLHHPLSVSPSLNTDYLNDPNSISFSITTPTSLLFPTSQMASSPAHGWPATSSGFSDRLTPLPQPIQALSNK